MPDPLTDDSNNSLIKNVPTATPYYSNTISGFQNSQDSLTLSQKQLAKLQAKQVTNRTQNNKHYVATFL